MSKLTKREKYGLKRRLSNIAHTLTGMFIGVREIVGQELGYTLGQVAVYVNFYSKPHCGKMNKAETIRFIRGICFHELLHLLETDFTIYNDTITSVDECEQEIMNDIYNILEDSAIENFAPLYMSDELVADLNYMKSVVYQKSPPIDESNDPFIQFICASIQYGDAGLLKGKFRSKAAQKCFLRCVPIMDKAVEEPDNLKRSQYAKEIFNISKPLWIEHRNAREMDKFLDNVRKRLGENGKGISSSSKSGSGAPLDPVEPGTLPPPSARSKRRKVTVRRVSAEEFKKAMESAAEAPDDSSDGDIEVLIPDSPVEVKPSEKAASGTSDPTPASSHKTDRSAPGSSTEIPSPAEGSEITDEKPFESEKEAEASLEAEGVISAETAARIYREMNEAERELEEEERKETADAIALPDYQITGGLNKICGRYRCHNIRQRIDFDDMMRLEETYSQILEPMAPGIERVSKQLMRIFKNAPDEKQYRTCGKVDIDRLCSGKKTVRVFTRKRIMDKSNMYVCIAVDCSASMRGQSILQARNAGIALAEVFCKLNIPISIFGFTADNIKDYDATHIHFITGANTHRDRLRLLGIRAMDNNFDGYSIRFGAEILKKKSAAHKMLIVISDGTPLCSAYYDVDGIADTKLAIKEASKDAVVFGILVGKQKPTVHRAMYGYNFMHIKNPDDLFAGLAKCISKQIKEW